MLPVFMIFVAARDTLSTPPYAIVTLPCAPYYAPLYAGLSLILPHIRFSRRLPPFRCLCRQLIFFFVHFSPLFRFSLDDFFIARRSIFPARARYDAGAAEILFDADIVTPPSFR